MSLAAATRNAVDARPFLRLALRAGVCNYTAAARYLPVEGDRDAVATALRRYAEALPSLETTDRRVRVAMESGLGPVAADEPALLAVGDLRLGGGGGSTTGIVATGEVDTAALATVLGRCVAADVAVEAAGVGGDALVLAVGRRDGADALRLVESALEAVPTPADRRAVESP